MPIERSLHPGWLSNAYLVWDEAGGDAMFVDSGAPLEPLIEAVERERLTPTTLLVTHGHPDHIAGNDELVSRYGVEVLTAGGAGFEALPTPGHSDDHVSLFGRGLCFSGDILCRDTVGGGSEVEPIRRSVMEVLMKLPPETRVLPGHTDETTIGREWEENPFVRYWRGDAAPLDEPVRFRDEDVTLLVWSPDYDGKGKALVRFADGREAVVGGSRIQR